jgi:hypothetical protein
VRGDSLLRFSCLETALRRPLLFEEESESTYRKPFSHDAPFLLWLEVVGVHLPYALLNQPINQSPHPTPKSQETAQTQQR